MLEINSIHGAAFKADIGGLPCEILIDSGAQASCISEQLYHDLCTPGLQQVFAVGLVAANGSDLGVKGRVKLQMKIKDKVFSHQFYVCEHLTRPVLCGLDFLMKHQVMIGGGKNNSHLSLYRRPTKGKLQQICEVRMNMKPTLKLKEQVVIPPRHAISAIAKTRFEYFAKHQHWETCGSDNLPEDVSFQEIVLSTKGAPGVGQWDVPVTLVNHTHKPVIIAAGTRLTTLQPVEGEVFTEEEYAARSTIHEVREEKVFLTSPADIDQHAKVPLNDCELEEGIKEQFEEIRTDFKFAFSKDSGDFGKTELIYMDIDTGDSPPVAQRPYSLALKHIEWVNKEILELEKAGIIVKSISPWASPIVIVPKKSAPGEPIRRRMCVDYRAVNALLPEVKKVGTSSKGVLTLIPLPKIDELYGELNGATVFSSLDVRAGYHNIGLTAEARPKTAFVIPGGKWEFVRVPFGLSQAPAYFQRMINTVLEGLPFARGYLDDILIFSKTQEEHLQHIRAVLERIKAAGLKLKLEKCDFFKTEIFYLGHLVGSEGIRPMKDKVIAIKNMAAPTTIKEVQSFLGSVGYYRKFIPHFSDIAQPIVSLVRKDEVFEWTKQRQSCFELLKETLNEEPILVYPDPQKPYVLFTDASKNGWGGVLTQPVETKGITKLHPVHFVSGLFRGSQRNWAALTKEAYAIYQSVKKLSFYLTDADVTLRSDHKPLQKFLVKETLNTMVNNWAVELEQYNIKFDFIEGKKNALADMMSRLLPVLPEIALQQEPEGYEFGQNITAQIEINAINKTTQIQLTTKEEDVFNAINVAKLIKEQHLDTFTKNIKDPKKHPYVTENQVVYRLVPIGLTQYQVPVIPKSMILSIIRSAHEPGHNGLNRTYELLRRQIFYPKLKNEVQNYVKNCVVCAQVNRAPTYMEPKHFTPPQRPMDFVCMDLVGGFPETFTSNVYALTCIDVLTGYVWAIPVPDKTAESIVLAFMIHIYPFGMPRKILTDNGTEFVNELFKKVADELGCEHKITIPAYHPQSNGLLEGFHYFLKTCSTKLITHRLPWDKVLHLACASYNFFPSTTRKESPFFLMFGRDPRMKLNEFLRPRFRYVGDSQGLMSLDTLHACYWLACQNLARTHRATPTTGKAPTPFAPGQLVFTKNHTAKSFDIRYHNPSRILKVYDKQLKVIDHKGKVTTVAKEHCKNVPTHVAINKTTPTHNKDNLGRFYVDPTKLPYPKNLQLNLITYSFQEHVQKGEGTRPS